MSPGALVLWEPSEDSYQAVSPSVFSTGEFERIWSATGPAPHPLDRAEASPLRFEEKAVRVLAPEDLNDEGDSRWRRRVSFGRRPTRS